MIIIMCDGPRIKPVPPFFSRCENILLAILPGMYYNTTNRCAPPCCGRRSRSAPIRPCQRGTANISAGMMELVDVADSKSAGGDTVPVRLRLPAPRRRTLRTAQKTRSLSAVGFSASGLLGASSPRKIFDFAGTPFFGGESWHGHILFGRSFSCLLRQSSFAFSYK